MNQICNWIEIIDKFLKNSDNYKPHKNYMRGKENKKMKYDVTTNHMFTLG